MVFCSSKRKKRNIFQLCVIFSLFYPKSAMIVEFISTEIMECSASFKDASDNLTNLFTFGPLYLQIQPIKNINQKKQKKNRILKKQNLYLPYTKYYVEFTQV